MPERSDQPCTLYRHGDETDALDTWASADAWLADERAIAIATVIDTWGSAPVPVGGQMVIADDQTFAGSVSGGCVEAEVVVAALDAIASGRHRRVAFGVENEKAWSVGLPCGGKIEVLIQPFAGARARRQIGEILKARAERRALVIETDFATGETILHDDPDSLSGPIAERFQHGRSGVVRSGDGEAFVHVLRPAHRVIIVGATHIAQAMVAFCHAVGLRPLVIDPRESFASPERFGATEVIGEWPGEALNSLVPDRFTAVAVVAHVAHIDDEALLSALASPVPYVGALGSRRNHAKRRERLLAAGLSPRDFEKIRSPIGLDIGAVTPEEIALSIVSEIVLAFRGPKRRATVEETKLLRSGERA